MAAGNGHKPQPEIDASRELASDSRSLGGARPSDNASKGGYFLDTEAAFGPGGTTKPWPDAKRAEPLPPLREPVTGKPRLAVDEILRGKHILLIGTTGFVGKVALSMLLYQYPEVGKV